MAIEVIEQHSEVVRGGESPRAEKEYVILGTDNAGEARLNMLIFAPPLWYIDQYIGTLTASDDEIDREPVKDGMWRGKVIYSDRQRKKTGESEYEFETSGGTQKIMSSLATVGSWQAPGQNFVDTFGLIGNTGETVEGCEVVASQAQFSERHYIQKEFITGAYKTTLYLMTGTVNLYQFRGCAHGEVLFLGARGRIRQDQSDWEIEYKFAASPNMVNLTIGEIQGIQKRGWDYLWIWGTPDADGGMLVTKPMAVKVEQVYRYTDFSLLGIGTA